MLETIKETFNDIRDAIVEMGVDVDPCDSPTTYADRILDIGSNVEGGGVGRTILFIPVFKEASSKPAKPTTTMSANNPTAYPSGWSEPNVDWTGKVWMSYTIVGNNSTYVSWTDPIPVVGKYCTCSGGGTTPGGDDSGSDTPGGGDTPGGDDQPYDPSNPSGGSGLSITNTTMWMKITSAGAGISSPSVGYNPTDSGWTTATMNPTADSPYLWAFFEFTYSGNVGDTGYNYTRTPAFILRRYNSDASQDYQDLSDLITNIRDEVDQYKQDINDVIQDRDTELQEYKQTLENNIDLTLDDFNDRMNAIEQTGTSQLTGDGLWGILTSYRDTSEQDANVAQKKGFADLILNAEDASALLHTGSRFFQKDANGVYSATEIDNGLSLNSLSGQIQAKATQADIQSYVDTRLASATLEVNPSAIISAVSKGSLYWENNSGQMVPYAALLNGVVDSESDPINWADESDAIAAYESYMKGQYVDSHDVVLTPVYHDLQHSVDITGPFTGPKSIIDEFSTIQQTANSINASLYKSMYVWKDQTTGTVYEYDRFKSVYNDYGYGSYDAWVQNYYQNQYTKELIGTSLSDLLLKVDQLRSLIANTSYVWRSKQTNNLGNYTYLAYTWPNSSNPTLTQSEYEAQYTDNWNRINLALMWSSIDQTIDSIKLTVANNRKAWVSDFDSNENLVTDYTIDAQIYDYDEFRDEYQDYANNDVYSYEEFVQREKNCHLVNITDSIAQISETSKDITLDVQDAQDNISALQLRADGIDMTVAKGKDRWVNNNNNTDWHEYDYWYEDYFTYISHIQNGEITKDGYEEWVESEHPNYHLVEADLSGIKLRQNEIWQGVSRDGKIAASIKILAGTSTNDSKIILDANQVEVNGNLKSSLIQVINATDVDTSKISGTIITPGTITTDHLYANTITADKINLQNLAENSAFINYLSVKHLNGANGVFTGTLQFPFVDMCETTQYVSGSSSQEMYNLRSTDPTSLCLHYGSRFTGQLGYNSQRKHIHLFLPDNLPDGVVYNFIGDGYNYKNSLGQFYLRVPVNNGNRIYYETTEDTSEGYLGKSIDAANILCFKDQFFIRLVTYGGYFYIIQMLGQYKAVDANNL